MEENFTELEEKIFKYFLNDFECYATNKLRGDNLKEIFSDWVEEKLESKSFFHKSINEFFYPELNISEEDLLISIRQNDLTFKDYIIGVMKKFDLESYLMKDNILNIRESEEVLDSQEEQSKEDIEAATKQVAIKDMLGVEDLDLSNLEPEELDNLMVKAAQDSENKENEDDTETKMSAIKQKLDTENLNLEGLSDEELDTILYGKTVEEKIEIIASRFNEKNSVFYIHKYTGMNLKESKIVYDYFKEGL